MNFIKSSIYSVIDFIYPKGIPRTISGVTVRFPAMWSRLFVKGYEKDNFQFAKENTLPGATVLDIGAHIGLYSSYLAQIVGKQGKVYAFEPSPYTLTVLKKIVELNSKDAGEVIICPYAVSDKAGEITFNVHPDAAYVANSMVSIKGTVPIKVKMISIDEFRREKQLKIDFIKIDAEGAEYMILCGGRETFTKDRPKAHLGLHPWQIKEMGSSLEQIWDILQEYRLTVIQKENNSITKEWFCKQTDLFDVELVPRDE